MVILRRIWEAWKRVARIIGDFVGRLILTVFYFTIFVPFGLVVRLLSDPLRLRGASSSYWLSGEPKDVALEDARRQF